MICNNSKSVVFTRNGKDWEAFYTGNGNYTFSNMIPDLQSYTRTDPGWVNFDNGYCTWQGEPPQRQRTAAPSAMSASVPLPPQEQLEEPSSPSGGGLGVIVLLAVLGAIAVSQFKGKRGNDKTYHPMKDLPTRLPSLGGSKIATIDVTNWKEGDPIPEGYEVIEVDDEEDNTDSRFPSNANSNLPNRDGIKNDLATGTQLKTQWGEGYSEPNPWLQDSVTHLIHTEAAKATEARLRNLEGQANVPEIIHRYLGSEPPQQNSGSSGSPTFEPPSLIPVQPTRTNAPVSGSKPPEPLVYQGFQAPNSDKSTDELERDRQELQAVFESEVQSYLPLVISRFNIDTKQAVTQALLLGNSQNWICANLFQVHKGSSEDYKSAVTIIQEIRKELNVDG